MTVNPARYGRAMLLPLFLPLAAPYAGAGVILPSAISVSTPSGSPDTSNPFTDDVLLDSLTFLDTNDVEVVYNAEIGSFSVANRFEVLTGRSEINAEWGDNDDNSDGDPDPFTKAGLDPTDQETTDPAAQDAALLNAFNSRSISEISDGEGGTDFSFQILFEDSLAFDDVGDDSLPDLVLFERGLNDIFSIKLITGGSFEAPIFSDSLSINSGSFWKTGISINTTEINGTQELGVGGFDLVDFGLGEGGTAFGFHLSSTDGPDLGGFFLSAVDPEDFGDPLNAVPIPATAWMLLLGLGLIPRFSAVRRRSGFQES